LNGGDKSYMLLVGKLLENSYLYIYEGTLYILGIIHPLILAHSEMEMQEVSFYPHELSHLPHYFSTETS
jgi:hypothetical protein